MIKKILFLLALVYISGCTGVTFERGLNYEKAPEYIFDYDKGSHNISITRKNNASHISIAFGKGSSCGYYGLIGSLIFPIIPIWENRECDNVTIRIWEYYTGIRNVHIILQCKNYQPIEISEMNYYTFPLKTKSITDTAILVVEKNDGEIFEIPIRYKHSFSFDLWPGR